VRPLFTRPLTALSLALGPPLYMAYVRFVWATSRIERNDFEKLQALCDQHDGAVALLWHEEVFTVAYGYAFLGLRGHTLASLGNAGELISRILLRCNYVVFRGGSTTRQSRRREGVLDDLIQHMQTNHGVIYGLTVDGSRGPAYRMKMGGVIVASTCRKPIALVRTWYRRCIRLNTWDRTAIPLPFNTIYYHYRGPYFPPSDPSDGAALEAFRQRLEDDLVDLAAHSYDVAGQPRPPNLVKRGNVP
jgi:lysophospholipid acyltransferase (LPLAT)-like uncharacterized protein